MAQGRRSLIEKQGKISESEVRALILNIIVSETGVRKSWREIFSDTEFMDITGFWRRSRKGEREMISPGSIDYNIAKFKLTEKEIFEYHKYVTHRIPIDKTFEEWKGEHRINKKYDNVDFSKFTRNQYVEGVNRLFNKYGFDEKVYVADTDVRIRSYLEAFAESKFLFDKKILHQELKKCILHCKRSKRGKR